MYKFCRRQKAEKKEEKKIPTKKRTRTSHNRFAMPHNSNYVAHTFPGKFASHQFLLIKFCSAATSPIQLAEINCGWYLVRVERGEMLSIIYYYYYLFMEIRHLLYFRCEWVCSFASNNGLAIESINKFINLMLCSTALCVCVCVPGCLGACVFELLQSIINHQLKIGLLM